MKFDIRCIETKEKSLIKSIGDMLSFLKKDYPYFYNWYNGKVVNKKDNGSRNIYIATPVDNSNVIAGVLILKDTKEEKKICTLCVMEAYRGNGIGSSFVELAIEVLKTNKPMITVSESNRDLFSPLLLKYKFEEKKEYLGYYRNGSSEFSYNGYLPEYRSACKVI